MKQKIYILLLIVLALLAAYFFFTNKSTTITSEFSDFAIEDTASIDRIFIADYDGNSIELIRQENNSWNLSNGYKARMDAIDLLLKTFYHIKVKEMVPETSREKVIKSMAGRSIKVEIYKGGNKPAKVYYVGNPTQNHFGTYMLLELDGKKSSVPYITHIPGFHGYLTARFFTDAKLWRNRAVFIHKAEDIQSIQIEYSEKPLKSFNLSREGTAYKVVDLNTRTPAEPLNITAIDEYISRFYDIHFESIPELTPFVNADSVTSTIPLQVITLTSKDGQSTVVKTYVKPVKESMLINPNTGDYYTYDLDRLYAWINEEDFVIMQYPTLDKILAYYDDFLQSENVDN